MKSIIIKGKSLIEYTNIELPVLGEDEVLIRTRAAGICGTDLHILHERFFATYPIIPGHEFSGEIVSIGKDVRDININDRVAVFPATFCNTCEFCRKGRPNHCLGKKAYGVKLNGGFSEYVKINKNNIYPIDNISFEEGALLEPLACVIYGQKRIKMEYGASVLIYGCGAVGLMHLQMSKLSGAGKIICVDINKEKLNKASELGANYTELADRGLDERLKNHENLGFDVIIDATGNKNVIQTLTQHIKDCGTILYFGVSDPETQILISPYDIYKKDINIVGSFTLLPQDFMESIKLIQSGQINVKTLISDRIKFEDTILALQKMDKCETLYKTVILFDN